VDSENITPAQVKQIIVSAKAIVGLEMIPHGDPGPGALASSSMVKVEPGPSDPRADTVCLPSLRVQVPRDQAFRWGMMVRAGSISSIMAQLDAVFAGRPTNPALTTEPERLTELLVTYRNMTREEMVMIGARKWALINRPEAIPGTVPKPPPAGFENLPEGVPAPSPKRVVLQAKPGFYLDGTVKPGPPDPPDLVRAKGTAVKGG
jgi:hypothetical protein